MQLEWSLVPWASGVVKHLATPDMVHGDQWVFLYYLPFTDALNGWWQVRVGDGMHGNRDGFTEFYLRNAYDCDM